MCDMRVICISIHNAGKRTMKMMIMYLNSESLVVMKSCNKLMRTTNEQCPHTSTLDGVPIGSAWFSY